MPIPVYPVGAVVGRPLSGLWGLLGYRHVGVYVGAGRVIHFDGTPMERAGARLREDDIDAFSGGYDVSVYDAPRNPAHGAAVAAEARRLLREENHFDGRYDVVFNNCEGFTRHCFAVEYEP
jgi:hypothetical protein